MPRPSDIVDFLPARVDGVARRDLEQRLKRLRAARLYPPARAVGDRPAEPVNDHYMANLFLALVGSAEAKYCAEAVHRLDDLTAVLKAPAKGKKVVPQAWASPFASKITLGQLLALEIRLLRRGKSQSIQEVWAVDGGTEVVVVMGGSEDVLKDMSGETIVFGKATSARDHPSRDIFVRLPGRAIKALADFLGPIEDSAA